ncbi:hypothetical protein LIH_01730 [Leptospira interrogans serovar Hardjo-prajitno]|uniref:Uncharacterized protein n=1 Tax=Leptospira interrogans serovar Hardjo str. Norma TaxID=1279460 RepID=A0A0M4N2K6_LEPIR|nr:hypothetical protein G436_0380 [Leptospira interrogans serovar Hardjo str. Norma]ALN99076.1 hypothetical protein LIH_01730 [Leptospira interrogans serovar Hardjo-prajitno]
MWELPQITILKTNSKIVGTHTFRKFSFIFPANSRYISFFETFFVRTILIFVLKNPRAKDRSGVKLLSFKFLSFDQIIFQ